MSSMNTAASKARLAVAGALSVGMAVGAKSYYDVEMAEFGYQNAVRTLQSQQTAMLQSSRKQADSQAAIATAIAAKQTAIDELAAAERAVLAAESNRDAKAAAVADADVAIEQSRMDATRVKEETAALAGKLVQSEKAVMAATTVVADAKLKASPFALLNFAKSLVSR